MELQIKMGRIIKPQEVSLKGYFNKKSTVVAGNQTNGIAGTKDNIVTDPKVSEDDAEEKSTEMDENRASDKDGKDDQATRSEFERLLQQEKQTVQPNSTNSINTVSTPVSAAGPSFSNNDPSSPINAAEASNAFEEHLFERFSPFKNAFKLPPVSNVTLMDDTGIFGNAYDDEDVGAEADLNNLETTMNMDVKSAFLYGTIDEEVYVCQPHGFEDPQFPNKVYKVEKALYGLHQAPRAWYETLSTYLIKNGFRRGTIDKTLLIKKDKDHNLWDVIVNGDLEEEPAPTTGETSAPPAPKTAKQLAARRNQERVKIKHLCF
ncbi:putative ribonuclease H-like domain-containing protein [Tanacetum coccineum]